MSTVLESPSPSAKSVSNEAVNQTRSLTVALAGNPNAGKTSLFNALTGLRQKVANYPGVTVERKEGLWTLDTEQTPARLVDLPGLYSLEAASIDERIARDVLTGRAEGVPAPDVVVAVVDATNLERNLYLVTQLLEVGRPAVVALTMIDLAERDGLEVYAGKLAASLGVPVVPVTARQGRGLAELAEAVMGAATSDAPRHRWRLSERGEEEVEALLRAGYGTREEAVGDLFGEELPREAERRALVEGGRDRLASANPRWWQEPLTARYEWIERAANAATRRAGDGSRRRDATQRIDRVVLHRFFGPVILLAVMVVVFQTIFSWASVPMELIDRGFGSLGEVL